MLETLQEPLPHDGLDISQQQLTIINRLIKHVIRTALTTHVIY